MKRRILPLTLALIAALFLSVNACAAAEYGVIYTEAEMLRSEELTDLGELYMPRFTVFYDVDFRVDVLTGIGNFSSLEEAAAAIYDEYDYGYGEGRNGVSLTMLVHEDEDGVVLDEWYLYAAGDSNELTTNGIWGAVAALDENMSAEDWAGDAQQDSKALEKAINITMDHLEEFILLGGVADTIPDAGAAVPETVVPEENPSSVADSFPAAGESLAYVTDTAGILNAEERRTLVEQAQEISETHGFGVYIITVDSFRQTTGCTQVDDGAVALYQTYDLGLGDERKGVLLLLSMQERDFSLITYSDYGNYVFDEENREWIAGCFLDDFSYDHWYSGFSDYLEECDWTLAEGPDRLRSEINAKLGMIFLIPLMIAAVVIVVLSQKMKSVAKATQAEAYAGDGIDLSNSYDRFTHATETRRKRKEESSGGGGGGRTHSRSSGGFGRTSGKF